ncbi:hypothetical protein AQUCO_01000733v1 [Aquilegia coerulea]|uniref:Uncharacterized protein n=1 Tax=Aquilegia coerulea TaxID=218851 RepID=A0A2G5EBH2_AQUCA|nr:hypothetical protein AQUCO_01000733v1 [Aquilegia coerulea]
MTGVSSSIERKLTLQEKHHYYWVFPFWPSFLKMQSSTSTLIFRSFLSGVTSSFKVFDVGWRTSCVIGLAVIGLGEVGKLVDTPHLALSKLSNGQFCRREGQKCLNL